MHDPLKQRLKTVLQEEIKFSGDFYSKARPVKQEFELSLFFWMHSAEMYDQNNKHNSKMKVYTGPDYRSESPGKAGM
jgi:hypothetical protein